MNTEEMFRSLCRKETQNRMTSEVLEDNLQDPAKGAGA
jgi:hypothetical protein